MKIPGVEADVPDGSMSYVLGGDPRRATAVEEFHATAAVRTRESRPHPRETLSAGTAEGVDQVGRKERPILFSGPMVRAILEDEKTQTRRVVVLEPWMQRVGMSLDGAWADPGLGGGEYLKVPGADDSAHRLRCPYGQIGDRLWVRETWYCDDYRVQKGPYLERDGSKELLYYRERDDAGAGRTYTGFSGETMDSPWRPSIHMPRWASRITLELSEVRVQRLQNISAEDCLAEGIRFERCGCEVCSRTSQLCPADQSTAVELYRELWDSLNASRGYGWATHPWVWVLGFRRVDP